MAAPWFYENQKKKGSHAQLRLVPWGSSELSEVSSSSLTHLNGYFFHTTDLPYTQGKPTLSLKISSSLDKIRRLMSTHRAIVRLKECVHKIKSITSRTIGQLAFHSMMETFDQGHS